MSYDYLIVGAGFTGSVMARQLAEAGKKVLLIDKRDHIGGNAYDYLNEHGVRIHKYGPHIFHTNSERVSSYLSRFTEWRAYEHRVMAHINLNGAQGLVPFPINLDTLEMVFKRSFTEHQAVEFLNEQARRDYHGGPIETAEDMIIAQVGRSLFELFFANYTRTMWGVEAKELDKSVTARIPVRFDRDNRYFTDRFQAMPRDGYAALFENMLAHPNIEFTTGLDYFRSPYSMWKGNVIWTGPIDSYFKHRFGPLPYRSIMFTHSTTPESAHPPGVATINCSSGNLVGMTRGTDMTILTDRGSGSYLVQEFPQAEGEPYYPIPSPEAHALYKRYAALAEQETSVTFLGRLGRYQYINMDQAVGQALNYAERLAA